MKITKSDMKSAVIIIVYLVFMAVLITVGVKDVESIVPKLLRATVVCQ